MKTVTQLKVHWIRLHNKLLANENELNSVSPAPAAALMHYQKV